MEEPQVRLAELLAVLSFGLDLGLNQPMEHVLRTSLIALDLGELVGMDERQQRSAYYSAFLSWIGCHVDAYEQAKWFGDDLALKRDIRRVDMTGLNSVAFVVAHVGAGRPAWARARLGMSFLRSGRQDAGALLQNHWYAADELAGRLGLDENVRQCLYQSFERWDGRGPGGIKGEQILLPARVTNLADALEVFHRAGGTEAAVSVARDRSGTQFDPELVRLVCNEAPALFGGLEAATSWEAAMDAEPGGDRVLAGARYDAALEALADFVDVKSPYTLGHSRAVAELSAEAGRSLGLPADGVDGLRRAALVHDLGRLAVSNAIWDKTEMLTPVEQERVRLHPYLTQRMLASSTSLAPLAKTAVQHHERMDGSGYPRGLVGAAITPAGRILAAADAYQTKREPRPHRSALSAGEAADALRAEVRRSRLDGAAVHAVLVAAGHRARRLREWPAGLTRREVEVLRLLARGLATKEIAGALVISPKTAANHVEHIYAKIGVSNRALASLFAVEHGLMTEGVLPTPG